MLLQHLLATTIECMDSFNDVLQLLIAQTILFLPKLLAALTIFIAGIYFSNLLIRLTVAMLERRKVRPELTQFISSYGYVGLVTLVVMTTLQQVDFNLTAFIAGLGIVGFTAGFALQDITQNVVSGLILLAQRPFEIGELVEISEFVGYVRRIDVRATTIETLDGRDVLIPNYGVMSNPITNYSHDPKVRVDIQLCVSYEDNIDLVRELTRRALLTVPIVLNDPPIEVRYQSFNDSSLELRAYYWIDIEKTPMREARDGGVTAIMKAYRQAGVVIPYPIQVELSEAPRSNIRIPKRNSSDPLGD